MFIKKDAYNLGEKLDDIKKNLFINDFLYDILDKTPTLYDQMVMRKHFTLNDEF